MSSVNPVREGFTAVTPYLYIRNASQAIVFYNKAFGATEVMRLEDPNSGKIFYASIKLGQGTIMLSDEFPEMGFRGPQTLQGSSCPIHLYVDDADSFIANARKHGAKTLKPIQDQFFGDRSGVIEDPYGHVWMVATQKVAMSPEEMTAKFKSMFTGAK